MTTASSAPIEVPLVDCMRVLVIGSGGREHALCARIASSPLVAATFCAPGNGGTSEVATNLPLDVNDVKAIVALANAHAIDFVVVGPEAPLVAGAIDALSDAGILAFGPRKAAALFEGSKAFSKRFMAKHGIPTASFATFTDADAADAYVKKSGQAWVVKADGLAAGKGVIVASDVAETLDAIDRIMRKREYGAAGAEVVLEQHLRGQEVSYHVVLDGSGRYVALAAAQDHKRLQDGDRGPNTGGMGAYSPPPVVTPEVEQRILARVVEPSVQGFKKDGIDFRGTLFIGLMIEDGQPSVLEYNTRFGDPETEVLMARYGGDVMALLLGSARGNLSNVKLQWDAPTALCVVLAAGNYPNAVKNGAPIEGLAAAADGGVQVLHAGTKRDGETVLTSGGRVLCVTGSGKDLDAVAERVYGAVSRIRFEGMQYRHDIGHHARTRAPAGQSNV